MWKFRCDMKYRGSTTNNITYRNKILIPKVHEIYNQRSLLLTLDQQQFPIPYDSVLLLKTPQLKHWIKKREEYLKASLHRASLYYQQIPRIQTFFHRSVPIQTNTPTNLAMHRPFVPNPNICEITLCELNINDPPCALPPSEPDPKITETSLLPLLMKPP